MEITALISKDNSIYLEIGDNSVARPNVGSTSTPYRVKITVMTTSNDKGVAGNMPFRNDVRSLASLLPAIWHSVDAALQTADLSKCNATPSSVTENWKATAECASAMLLNSAKE